MTDDFIFEIMEKFNSSNIVDLDLNQNGAHLLLRKKEAFLSKTIEIEKREERKSPAEPLLQKEEKKAESTKVKEESQAEVLKSPIVGTFYRSPSPDSPAYAEKGNKIKKGEPVCIIEAMKMMNTLNADYDFEVLDILVENGQLVEFDQPLFAIKKI